MNVGGTSAGGTSAGERHVWQLRNGAAELRNDLLAAEEPLEIQLRAGHESQTVAITMRTPGHDAELAAGFLFAEGVIYAKEVIRQMDHEPQPSGDNFLVVELDAPRLPPLPHLQRHFFTSSACGICGKTMLEEVGRRGVRAPAGPHVAPDLLFTLTDRLRESQTLFAATGGLHAAALFTAEGQLVALREDVGRHNALDKLVGWGLLQNRLPFHDHLLLVSGRASYELVQKALVAGIGLFCAVGAPSTLAVALAERFGATVVGFLREERCNVYCHPQRLM